MGKPTEFIASYLRIEQERAQTIKDLIDGQLSPERFIAVHLQDAEALPDYHKILIAIDSVLDGNGVERIGKNVSGEPLVYYVNMYDTFAPTVCIFNPCAFSRLFVYSTLDEMLQVATDYGYNLKVLL
jgi:hypothetical protein